MKIKVVVSLGAVIGLAALSVAAFVSTAGTVPTGTVSEQGMAVKTFVIREEPVEVLEKNILPIEAFSATELPDPMVESEIHEEPQRPGDAYLLAKIAMAEAEGEDTEGKALVMLVVLNRVKADGFPDSVEAVIYQPRQFSPVSSGRFDMVEPDADCWRALSLIELDGWDKSMGATYFESESESTWHEENLEFLFQHGNHYFYTDKGTGNE